MLQPGHTLQGRYTVRHQLGRGGMGSVYRAFDHRLSLDVAVKEFAPPPGLRPEELRQLQEQFRREATTLARLNHPGVVNVSDFFEEDGRAAAGSGRHPAGNAIAGGAELLPPAPGAPPRHQA